jgi:ubiquinone/menaquinone biosynthesis C-methylase UbiE
MYHNTIASQYDAVVVSPRRIINDAIFSTCAKQLSPGRVMLDLGCGTGHATLRFGRMFESIVAVDHSRAMQNEAGRNFELAGIRNVEVVNQDVLTFLKNRGEWLTRSFASVSSITLLRTISQSPFPKWPGYSTQVGACLFRSHGGLLPTPYR